MNFVKIPLVILSALTCLQAFATDVNVIDPSELPKKTQRSFTIRGRGTMPNFPENHGIESAMNDKNAQRYCMSEIGKQLTEWKTEKTHNIYWSYTISAEFECLPPVLSTVVENLKASDLSQALEGIKPTAANGIVRKDAKVLCYDFLEEVCIDNVLYRYKNHNVCELENLNTKEAIKIEDIKDNGNYLQEEGADRLISLLPIYVDGRRDDSPSGKNCSGHTYGKLKGLSRQAASVHCLVVDGKESCKIDGIIRPVKKE